MSITYRRVALIIVIALIVAIGFHALIPHEHPHQLFGGESLLSPIALHGDQKILLLLSVIFLCSFKRTLYKELLYNYKKLYIVFKREWVENIPLCVRKPLCYAFTRGILNTKTY